VEEEEEEEEEEVHKATELIAETKERHRFWREERAGLRGSPDVPGSHEEA